MSCVLAAEGSTRSANARFAAVAVADRSMAEVRCAETVLAEDAANANSVWPFEVTGSGAGVQAAVAVQEVS
jgi:hypothetical protein